MARPLLAALLSLSLGACALAPPSHLGGISTNVTPMDYARRLCAPQPLDHYPSCVSAVLDAIDRPRPDIPPPGASTSGPFAVIMDGELYLGEYSSTPFAARFSVSNGSQVCRGAYDVLHGSADALYDVHCDDGRAGWADTIRAHDGRNGIGKIMLDDGTQGDIVFGHVPLEGLANLSP